MDKKIWDELEKLRFGVDCLNGSNSTPLDGGFIPRNRPIKERLLEIFSEFPKENIEEELEFYHITIDWKIINKLLE